MGATNGCPVHGGGSDYEQYMRTDELLRLQKPESERLHHDELLFQTIHQAFELWGKLLWHELEEVDRRIEADEVVRTFPLLRRCIHVIKNQTEALGVLNSMAPLDFHVIRAGLGQGSGSESPGFRTLQAKAPRIWPTVEKALADAGTDLFDLYTHPERHPELVDLVELMTDFDMGFHLWRQAHLALVRRIIGRDVKSLKGYEVHQLEKDVHDEMLWPALWSVREQITRHTGTSPD